MDIGMTEHARPILTMDGYQLVALTQDHTYDPDRIIAYVVTTMSGARLHHARTLEEARSWMDRQVEGQVASPRKTRRRRTRPGRYAVTVAAGTPGAGSGGPPTTRNPGPPGT